MQRTPINNDSVILVYSDNEGVIYEVSLASILDGGFPIDPERGDEMDYLRTFIL